MQKIKLHFSSMLCCVTFVLEQLFDICRFLPDCIYQSQAHFSKGNFSKKILPLELYCTGEWRWPKLKTKRSSFSTNRKSIDVSRELETFEQPTFDGCLRLCILGLLYKFQTQFCRQYFFFRVISYSLNSSFPLKKAILQKKI